MITIEVRHDGLGRLERVVAPTKALAEMRADRLRAEWDGAFARRQAAATPDALAKLEADERTAEAERRCAALTSILIDALRTPPATDWSALADTSDFTEPAPVEPPPPQMEAEPSPADFPRAQLTLATLLNPRAMRRRKEAAESKFEAAHDGWLYLKRWRGAEFEKALAAHRAAVGEWQTRKLLFLERQARANARLDALAAGCRAGEPEAVIGHCDLNLLSLDRPEGFPRYWTMRFADGTLELDYDLPSMDAVPLVKAVKHVPSRGGFEVIALAERERERLYGEAVFQTALAVLATLFAGDAAGAIRSIAFKGWANYIDGVGLKPGRACILSVVVGRDLFTGLDLSSVDPQSCFRALNGTMSPKLAALSARQS